MSVDTRPVPINLLRWPRTRDLISQQKGILLYLWAHPQQTAAGCYLLPIDATAADLSMTSGSLSDALGEFHRRGLIELDLVTGEIWLPDWFRFYTPRTPAARGAAESAINKILSLDLLQKTKNSYESKVPAWKGKGKAKDKDKEEEAGGRRPPPQTQPAEVAAPVRKNFPVRSDSGIQCWSTEDELEAKKIEMRVGVPEAARAASLLESQNREALPSRVARQLETPAAANNWWASERATLEKGRELNLPPRVGESIEEFRRRIRSALAAQTEAA